MLRLIHNVRFFGPSESRALQTLEFKLERTLLSLVSHDFFHYELVGRYVGIYAYGKTWALLILSVCVLYVRVHCKYVFQCCHLIIGWGGT